MCIQGQRACAPQICNLLPSQKNKQANKQDNKQANKNKTKQKTKMISIYNTFYMSP